MLKKYISRLYFVFCTKKFDSYKTTIGISKTLIYGTSKTVRLAKKNVEEVLNSPDRRQASSRATSERTAYKKKGK